MKAQLKSTIQLFTFSCLISLVLFNSKQADAAESIHFSKYRFVFDDSQRKDSLLLTNTGLNASICTLSTVNFIMSDKGPAKFAQSPDEVSNSASKLLRFSPKRVSIQPNQNQTVRITSRRKPNIVDGEYLSHLKIDCIEETNPNEKQVEQITIKPKFIYYIPLQIRAGKLNATTGFENIKISSQQGRDIISFDHIRSGTRSVVGDIKIIEKDSGEVLGNIKNTVVYMPFNKKSHSVALSKQPKGPVEIIFTEDKLTRGTLVATAILNK
jgi:P pilus assembly chaperone PapD